VDAEGCQVADHRRVDRPINALAMRVRRNLEHLSKFDRVRIRQLILVPRENRRNDDAQLPTPTSKELSLATTGSLEVGDWTLELD
jgi:hypothetical protein